MTHAATPGVVPPRSVMKTRSTELRNRSMSAALGNPACSRADVIDALRPAATSTNPTVMKSRVTMGDSYCRPLDVVDGLTRSSGRIAVLMRAGRAPVLIFATIASFFRSIASVWSTPDTATYMYLLSGVGVIQFALGPTSTAPMYFRSGRLHP